MKLRIEGEHLSLKEIHSLIYQADKNQLVEEENKSTPGVHSEPIVIAIITALTPITIQAIRSWATLKKANIAAKLEMAKTEAEREKVRLAFDLEKTKIILKSGSTRITEFSAGQIDQLNTLEFPKDSDNDAVNLS